MKYLPIILLAVLSQVSSVTAQTGAQLTSEEISKLSYRVCDGRSPDKALFEQFEKAIAAQPKKYGLYLERAKCFLRIGDNDAMLKDVSAILILKPAFPSSLLLSDLDKLLGSNDQGERMSRSEYLITSNPNHFYPYQLRALAKMSIKDFRGAYEDYIKAIEIEPLHSMDRFGILGSSLYELEHDKKVIEYYTRAFSLYEKILQDFRLKREQGNGDEMTLFIMKGLSLQIADVLNAWSVKLADLYFEKGELERSNAVLEKMVRIPPASMAYIFRSGYYNRKGNLQKAEEDRIKSIEAKIEELTSYIEDKNTNIVFKPASYLNRGDLYLELKQYDKAIADYETAKSLDKRRTATADEKIEAAKQKMAQENNLPK